MQQPVSSNVAPHYSRQGQLMTNPYKTYMPPAKQADIDALVAHHKAAREYNSSLDTVKSAPNNDDRPRTIKRNNKKRKR
jgi:hypothetical protein